MTPADLVVIQEDFSVAVLRSALSGGAWLLWLSWSSEAIGTQTLAHLVRVRASISVFLFLKKDTKMALSIQ